MDEMSQLATAMMAVVFSAVLLVSGQLFIEYRNSPKSFDDARRCSGDRFEQHRSESHYLNDVPVLISE